MKFNPYEFEDERTALTIPLIKIGIAVECVVCHRTKKPAGRSAPLEMATSLCDHECPGWSQPPLPGSLWPGETEEQFGYDIGAHGWKEVAIAEPEPPDEYPRERVPVRDEGE